MTPSDQDVKIVLSARKTRRDLKVSLALAVVGGILFFGIDVLGTWRTATGGFAFLLLFVGYVGELALWIGLLFVGINWWLLRRREGGPRGPPSRVDPRPVSDASNPPSVGPSSGSVRTHVACPSCAHIWPVGQYAVCPNCRAPLSGGPG